MKMIHSLKFVLLLGSILSFVCAFGTMMTEAQMREYSRAANCTVSGYTGEGVNDFRLLVRISPQAITGFSYSDVLSDGRDIRFVLSDGTVLPHELDTWNPSGESTFWVRVTRLEKGFSFKMLYGKTGDAGADGNIWSDYVGVWHMNADSNGNISDSSANGFDAEIKNLDKTTSGTGIAGSAYCNPHTQTAGGQPYVNIPANDTLNALTGPLTFSVWFVDGRGANNNGNLLNTAGGSYGGAMGGIDLAMGGTLQRIDLTDKCGRTQGDVSANFSFGWNQVVVTYDGTNRRVYFNGRLCDGLTAAGNFTARSGYNWLLGTRSSGNDTAFQLVGRIDEFRTLGKCQDAEEIEAEYEMISSGVDFLSCAVENPDESFFKSFSMRFDIDVTGLADGVALTNFPLSVRLSSEAVPNFDPAAMRADGRDVCFALPDGTLLPFEVDTWDQQGESVYWVRVPELTGTTKIRCYYGRASAAFEGAGIGYVWNGYAGVWHVNESANGAVAIANSSACTLTSTGGAVSVSHDGVFGKARGSETACTEGGPTVFRVKAANDIDLGTDFTVSGWLEFNAGEAMYLVSRCKTDYTAAWRLAAFSRANGSANTLAFSPSAQNRQNFNYDSPVYNGAWHKFDLVCEGLNQALYLDGQLYGTIASTVETQQGTEDLAFGGSSDGAASGAPVWMDELRYSAGVRSAAWIETEYKASGRANTSLVTYMPAQPTDAAAYCKTFSRVIDLTVTGLTGDVPLTNFPLSVILSSETVPNFNPSEMRSDGRDIVFLSDDDEFLPFEVDTWNPNGASVYWVRVPELANGRHVYCYYGRARAAISGSSADAVWQGYTGVWHVNETEGGQVTLDDSSPTSLDMTGGSISTVTNGVFGKSRGYKSRGAVGVSCGRIPGSEKSRFDLGGSFTMSAWVNFGVSWQNYVFSASVNANGAGWKFYVDGKTANTFAFSAGAENTPDATVKQVFPNIGDAAQLNDWRKIDLVSDGLGQKLYMNGELVGAVTSPFEPTFGDYGLSVGGSAVDATYGLSAGAFFDEIHYSDGQRSADWIRAEYRASGRAATQLLTYSRAQKTRPSGLLLFVR